MSRALCCAAYLFVFGGVFMIRVSPVHRRHPALYWVQHGYACFVQDCRGRFQSEGKFTKYINEAEDGYDTIEWLAQQPWSDKRIFTFGVSYLAHTQLSAACLAPPSLAG